MYLIGRTDRDEPCEHCNKVMLLFGINSSHCLLSRLTWVSSCHLLLYGSVTSLSSAVIFWWAFPWSLAYDRTHTHTHNNVWSGWQRLGILRYSCAFRWSCAVAFRLQSWWFLWLWHSDLHGRLMIAQWAVFICGVCGFQYTVLYFRPNFTPTVETVWLMKLPCCASVRLTSLSVLGNLSEFYEMLSDVALTS